MATSVGTRYSRRAMLGLVTKAGLGTAVVGPLAGLAACAAPAAPLATPAPAKAPAATVPAATPQPTQPISKLTRPLRFHHDAAVGPVFQKYLDHFTEQYGIKIETSYVPQDYHPVTETQFLGGKVDYDVLFCNPGYIGRWYKAGWIQAIDGLPGLEELRKDMLPLAFGELLGPDGKVLGLPYYLGTLHLLYNKEHLEKAGAEVPKTWDDFIKVCKTIKDKGIVEYPFAPFWMLGFQLTWRHYSGIARSEGLGQLFDDKYNPVYEKDPAALAALEIMRKLYDNKLVPPDILTMDIGSVANVFYSGKTSFTIQHPQYLRNANDPKKSQVAGKAWNALLPGKTHNSHMWLAFFMMTAATPDRNEAWKLLNYIGGKDKNGQYYAPKNLVATDLGLGVPYKPLLDDPDIQKSLSAWSDPAIVKQQMELAIPDGLVSAQPWYIEWLDKTGIAIQQAVRGEISPERALKESADVVRANLK